MFWLRMAACASVDLPPLGGIRESLKWQSVPAGLEMVAWYELAEYGRS